MYGTDTREVITIVKKMEQVSEGEREREGDKREEERRREREKGRRGVESYTSCTFLHYFSASLYSWSMSRSLVQQMMPAHHLVSTS